MVKKIEEPIPTHLRSIDWNCQDQCRSVMACLVHGTSVQERARQKKISSDSSWWTPFHFNVVEGGEIKDHSSIFGTIYKYTPPFSHSSRAPDYVITFRGTLFKLKTFLRDIKVDWNILGSNFHRTSRARTALQVVQRVVSTYGKGKKIWLAGHSLGASLAMHVGKSMVKYLGIYPETFLFNPPYPKVPIEKLIKSEGVTRGIWIGVSFVKAGIAILMEGQRDKCNDYFDSLASWVPHIFVNRGDFVCNGYEAYFKHRGEMEAIGMESVGRLATQNSTIALLRTAFGKDAEPLHLLPSAKLTVNLNKYPGKFESHRTKQWWRSDLNLEFNQYFFSTDC